MTEETFNAPVFLHVYDILPEGLNKTQYVMTGKGVFHAAVEVYGREFCYGAGCGIDCIEPGSADTYCHHREPIALGRTILSEEGVAELIDRMSDDWRGEDYNLLNKNCCTFARVLLEELGANPMPGWVDRAARRGFESFAATGAQAVGVAGVRLVATRCAMSAAGPAGVAAWGGELVGGHVGSLVGENVAGDAGKQVGQNIGGIGGAVGAGATVGAFVGGPVGAGVGAGLGCASYAVGKAVTWAVQKSEPNKRMTDLTVCALQSVGSGSPGSPRVQSGGF